MQWLVGHWSQLGLVVGKSALMFGVAVLGLRWAERRTLAQWSIIDFVTAVAIGAIVGRTAVAGTQSFITGAVALITLLVLHRVLSWVRMLSALRRVLDHRVRVIVRDSVVQSAQLARCGLTLEDLEAQLRQRGVFDLRDLRHVLYESQGGLTLIRSQDAGAPLVHAALGVQTSSEPDSTWPRRRWRRL